MQLRRYLPLYSDRRPHEVSPSPPRGGAVATSPRHPARAPVSGGPRLMARDGARPSYDPAGPDHALRPPSRTCAPGRWMAMRTLLAETTQWWQWTQRTQVLAAAAAGTDVVRAWLAEDPGNAHAVVMHARVGVERAPARPAGKAPPYPRVVDRGVGRGADGHHGRPPRPGALGVPCWRWPSSIRSSAGRSTGPPRRSRCCRPAPGGCWPRPAGATRFNREAHHRMLQFLYARGGAGPTRGGRGVRAVGLSQAPPGSALHLLPLYVRVERYRRDSGHDAAAGPALGGGGGGPRGTARAALLVRAARLPPSARCRTSTTSPTPCGGSLQFRDAARVFEAIGPYFTPPPWMYRTPDRDRSRGGLRAGPGPLPGCRGRLPPLNVPVAPCPFPPPIPEVLACPPPPILARPFRRPRPPVCRSRTRSSGCANSATGRCWPAAWAASATSRSASR